MLFAGFMIVIAGIVVIAVGIPAGEDDKDLLRKLFGAGLVMLVIGLLIVVIFKDN